MKTHTQSLCAMLLLAASICFADYPRPSGYVNDFAGIFSQDQAASLNAELVNFEKTTSIELAVAIVKSLDGQNVEDYAIGMATSWGVGKEGKNNGVLFLVSVNDRKMRIQTASGSKALLPDAAADNIRDRYILPNFRAKNMEKGVIDGTHAMMNEILANFTGQSNPDRVAVERNDALEEKFALTFVLIVFGILLFVGSYIFFATRQEKRQDRAYVLENKGRVRRLIENAKTLSKNPDVQEKTRATIEAKEKQLAGIMDLTATTPRVKWTETRGTLDEIEYAIKRAQREMGEEMAYAKKARKEGPQLLKSLPRRIAKAEADLENADKKNRKQAQRHLEEARRQLTMAEQSQSGMTTLDWVLLYAFLSGSDKNVSQAETVSKPGYTPDSSYNSNSSTSTYRSSSDSMGFGGSGGFGGGGGFSGGGGSSGDW